eukprot:CAMPEP_0197024536 /NCGR_PEP_ID=MMETSP1384-20130603/5061_1 /TAXON_ID=29189 /ORGANISM="Ammonia sp." /LENGTH=364 /DNA_ID=CAMNT_0042452935 /DNA_START=76 /DNA_END=1170 /DNA_ORIENTATION=-
MGLRFRGISTLLAASVISFNTLSDDDDIVINEHQQASNDYSRVWMLIRQDMQPESFTNSAFTRAFARHGIDLRVIKPNEMRVAINNNVTTSNSTDATCSNSARHIFPDVVFGRSGSFSDDQTLSIYKQLELSGVHVINSYDAVRNCQNKFLQYQILRAHGLPVPKTYLLNNSHIASDDSIKRLIDTELEKHLQLKYPVVLKYCHGSGGNEVLLIENKESLRALLSIYQIEKRDLNNEQIMIQEYIANSHGKSLRAIVAGDKVIASSYKENATGFKSNFHGGTTGSIPAHFQLSEETQQVCVQASQALGLEFSGIDLLFAEDGFLITEVNSCSGLESTQIANATIDIADKFVEYLLESGRLSEER